MIKSCTQYISISITYLPLVHVFFTTRYEAYKTIIDGHGTASEDNLVGKENFEIRLCSKLNTLSNRVDEQHQ
jgi:hypothetical protein